MCIVVYMYTEGINWDEVREGESEKEKRVERSEELIERVRNGECGHLQK